MPLDTEAKRRRAAVAAGLSFIPAPPKADGVISAADRAALAGVYIAGGEEAGIGIYRARYAVVSGHRGFYRTRY